MTIREISEATNLSIATVSKVLNGKSGVRDETREAVMAAARKLNYRPNLNARYLKSGRSHTLGIITEDFTVFNAPEIVDSIAAACEEAGYHYIIGNLRYFKRYGNGPRDEMECAALTHDVVNEMLARQVDGLFYIGYHSHMVVSLSEHRDAKFVCAYCISSDPNVPSVIYDDRTAAREVTETLLKYGERKIGMITGPMDSIHTTNRVRGHQEALFARGVPYNPGFTLEGDWGRDCGFALGERLIKGGATAIFAQNDLMAMGVLDYCNLNGVEVGRDVLLIGFDNREVSTICRPTLSTVALPLSEIGRTAAGLMFKILEGNEPAPTGEHTLECAIIERESTKGPSGS